MNIYLGLKSRVHSSYCAKFSLFIGSLFLAFLGNEAISISGVFAFLVGYAMIFHFALYLSCKRAAFLGFLWGMCYYLWEMRTLLWFDIKFPWALLSFSGLSFFLAVYFSFFVFFVRHTRDWWTKAHIGSLSLAAVWTLFEASRWLFFCGLPFGYLGVNLSGCLPIFSLTKIGGPMMLSFWCSGVALEIARLTFFKGISYSTLLLLILLYLAPLCSWSERQLPKISYSVVDCLLSVKKCVHTLEEIWDQLSRSIIADAKGDIVILPESLIDVGIDFPMCVGRENGQILFKTQAEIIQTISNRFSKNISIGLSEFKNRKRMPLVYFCSSDGKCLIMPKKYLLPLYEFPFSGLRKDSLNGHIASSRVLKIGPIRYGVVICFESLLPWMYESLMKEDVSLFAIMNNYAALRNTNFFCYHLKLMSLHIAAYGIPGAYVSNYASSGMIDCKGKNILCYRQSSPHFCHSFNVMDFSMAIVACDTLFKLLRTKRMLLIWAILSLPAIINASFGVCSKDVVSLIRCAVMRGVFWIEKKLRFGRRKFH